MKVNQCRHCGILHQEMTHHVFCPTCARLVAPHGGSNALAKGIVNELADVNELAEEIRPLSDDLRRSSCTKQDISIPNKMKPVSRPVRSAFGEYQRALQAELLSLGRKTCPIKPPWNLTATTLTKSVNQADRQGAALGDIGGRKLAI
jgi:ribosomal protein S27E